MGPTDAERQWAALLDAARAQLDRHELIAARGTLREAMSFSDRTWGPDDGHLIKPLRMMAESLWREHGPLERHNAPELGCLQRALAIARRRLPADHLEVGLLAGEVGTHLVSAGELDEACALMMECVEIGDKIGTDFSRFLEFIAHVRMEQGRAAEALPFIERAVVFQERRDPRSVRYAFARYHLGRCLFALGRHHDALAELQRALDLVDAQRTQGRHAALVDQVMEMIERVQRHLAGAQPEVAVDANAATSDDWLAQLASRR